ncbi:hypothetical protein [Kribbella sp. NPDC000426]|uniref:RNA polymerase sigma factor n=1 Tax=Kribbella sp. NPDC000426 TaxID=3154255 RepID=UPI0033266248
MIAFLFCQGAGLADAAEVAQDTMTELYREWWKIENPRAWTRRVGPRIWVRHRLRRREDLVAETPEPSPILRNADIEHWEHLHDIVRGLDQLPARQRQVLTWSLFDHTPQRDRRRTANEARRGPTELVHGATSIERLAEGGQPVNDLTSGPDVDKWLADAMKRLHDELDLAVDIDAGLADARRPRLQHEIIRALDGIIDPDAGLTQIMPHASRQVESGAPIKKPKPAASLLVRVVRELREWRFRFVRLRGADSGLHQLGSELSERPKIDRLVFRNYDDLLDSMVTTGVLLRLGVTTIELAARIHSSSIRLRTVGDLRIYRFDADAISREVEALLELLPGEPGMLQIQAQITHIAWQAKTSPLSGSKEAAGHAAYAAERSVQAVSDRYFWLALKNLSKLVVAPAPRSFSRAVEADRKKLDSIVLSLRDHSIGKWIRPTLPQELQNFARLFDASAARIVDLASDMTGADLTQADLSTTNLTGVIWSSTTNWPLGWQNWIEEHSAEITPNLFKIQGGNRTADLDRAST